MNKLKTFDSSYFIGKSHFEEDGTQNYLVFQPMYRFIMNKHNQKPTYMFNKQDVTVYLTCLLASGYVYSLQNYIPKKYF